MSKFTDNQGREWNVAVDINGARAVRNELGVNILDIRGRSGPGLPALSEDPILLVDVLFVLCRAQCEQREVRDEEFGRAMVGDAIEDAGNALVEALIDFFPEKKRRLLQEMAKAGSELQRVLAEKAAALLPATTQKLGGIRST